MASLTKTTTEGLRALYWDGGLTLEEIGARCTPEVSRQRVQQVFADRGIPTRGPGWSIVPKDLREEIACEAVQMRDSGLAFKDIQAVIARRYSIDVKINTLKKWVYRWIDQMKSSRPSD